MLPLHFKNHIGDDLVLDKEFLFFLYNAAIVRICCHCWVAGYIQVSMLAIDMEHLVGLKKIVHDIADKVGLIVYIKNNRIIWKRLFSGLDSSCNEP